jgi:hypothetical protein
MTVRELIERLHTLPEDGIVVLRLEDPESESSWLEEDFVLRTESQRPSVAKQGEWVPAATREAKRTAVIIQPANHYVP